MSITDRIAAYVSALPLPLGGTARREVQRAQAIHAAGLPIEAGLLARCWAASCEGSRADALKYLRGARPWPGPGRKRGRLVRAVEAWEYKPMEQA